MATVDLVQLATQKIEMVEAWGEAGFPEGLADLRVRAMPCEVTPIEMADPPGAKAKTESRGVVCRLEWIGRSGPGTKNILVRFNPKGRGVSKDPTGLIYVIRKNGEEELLISCRVPVVELEAEVDAPTFIHGILRREFFKDVLCSKLFLVYREELVDDVPEPPPAEKKPAAASAEKEAAEPEAKAKAKAKAADAKAEKK